MQLNKTTNKLSIEVFVERLKQNRKFCFSTDKYISKVMLKFFCDIAQCTNQI